MKKHQNSKVSDNPFFLLLLGMLLILSACSSSSSSSSDTSTDNTSTTTTDTSTDNTSTTTTLSAPTGLTVTSRIEKTTLSWTAVSGASSYTIYWGTSIGISSLSTAITSVSTNSYSHTSLTGGTTYYYKVAAVDSAGTGTLSSEVSAAIPNLMGGAIQNGALSLSTSVTTFAGKALTTGTDNGTGTAARFKNARKITTDGTNLYVTDMLNNTIRKIVISSGEVTTLAGTAGSSGTVDGTGTAAKFNNPLGITTDGTNLYVTDYNNSTIRKIVISSGVVTTLAGTAGITGTDNGTGTAAKFNYPADLTTDGTNLYVADTFNHTIRQIVISSGEVTTLAGTAESSGYSDATGTSARFYQPFGITTDGTNLYVADKKNHRIRKIVITSGAVTTLAGDGYANSSTNADNGTNATIGEPEGITTDGTNLYVTGFYRHEIRKIVIASTSVTTVAGAGGISSSDYGSADNTTGTDALFKQPTGITTDGTNLFVADYANSTIRKIE
jgi:hypothetical protein